MKTTTFGWVASVALAGVLALGTGCKDDKKTEAQPTPSATPSASTATSVAATPSAAPSAAADDDLATEEDFEEEGIAQISEGNLDEELRKLEDEIK
jgi:hypothetical protein